MKARKDDIYEGCPRCLRVELRKELRPVDERAYGGRAVCRICRREAYSPKVGTS